MKQPGLKIAALVSALILALAGPAFAQSRNLSATFLPPSDHAALLLTKPSNLTATFDASPSLPSLRVQSPRSPVGRPESMLFGVKFVYEKVSSESAFGGEANLCIRIMKDGPKKSWYPCIPVEFAFLHVTDGSALQVVGGFRMVFDSNPNMIFYAEGTFGIVHFLGDFPETDKLIKLGGGVFIPLDKKDDKSTKVFIQFGIPIFLFEGASESGFQLGFGILIPIGG